MGNVGFFELLYIIKKLSSFRKVYKGKCFETGNLVALKKFRIETEREGVMKLIFISKL